MRTAGERAFEVYLVENGFTTFEFERAHAGKRKRPDYSLDLDREYLFDVKDMTKDENLDFYKWIREQINQGSRKFREYKGWPCCVVMFAESTRDSKLVTPFCVLGAMYGDYGITIPFDESRGAFDSTRTDSRFVKDGKMMQPRFSKPQNTTITALITLRELPVGQARLAKYFEETRSDVMSHWDLLEIQRKVDFDISEKKLGAIVWENAYAAVRLPRELFAGKWDEWWAADDGTMKCVHVGAALAEFERAYSPPELDIFG
jgi:hypothetical protein